MLELRPSCEHCNCPLPADADNALICSFECTFCRDCVETLLKNVCPNCGGGFYPRPIRPKAALSKFPPTDKITFKPVDLTRHQIQINQLSAIAPEKR